MKSVVKLAVLVLLVGAVNAQGNLEVFQGQLFDAVREGDVAKVDILVKNPKIDLDAQENTEWGDTALLLALYALPSYKTMEQGSTIQRMIVKTLISHNASTVKQNSIGGSPLDYFSWQSDESIYYDPVVATLLDK